MMKINREITWITILAINFDKDSFSVNIKIRFNYISMDTEVYYKDGGLQVGNRLKKENERCVFT